MFFESDDYKSDVPDFRQSISFPLPAALCLTHVIIYTMAIARVFFLNFIIMSFFFRFVSNGDSNYASLWPRQTRPIRLPPVTLLRHDSQPRVKIHLALSENRRQQPVVRVTPRVGD